MPADNHENGYTLIELLFVILLLGILATAAVASYSGVLASIKLDAAGREIEAAFQYARNQSIKSDVQIGQEYGVWIVLPQPGPDNGNWFECIRKNGTPTPDGVIHPVDKKLYKTDYDEKGYFQGITVTQINLDANDQVFFDKRGTPSVAGSVVIRYAGEQRTISVSSPTGWVTIN